MDQAAIDRFGDIAKHPRGTSRHESKRRSRSSPVGQAAIDRFGDMSRQTRLSGTILPLFPQAGVHDTPFLAPSPSNQRLHSPLTQTCQLPGVYSLFVPQIQIAAQNGSLAGILYYEGLLDVNGASAQGDLFLFFFIRKQMPPLFTHMAAFAKYIVPVLFWDIIPVLFRRSPGALPRER